MKIYDQQKTLILDVEVDDNSYRNRAIMGDNALTLYFSLPEHVEIPVGAFCEFEGETYTLMRPQNLKMQHSRHFEYTVTMSGEQDKSKIWKFRNPIDGRLKFPLTATPQEHLQMFVDNMNRRDSGWMVGECISETEKLVNYDHDYCLDALAKMAQEFDTEYEIKDKQVSLRKIEYDKSDPLPLSYGRGNGFRPGIGRSNSSDQPPVEILYVQGGDRNIDRSKYGSGELHLPKNGTLGYDGEHFEDESGYDEDNARHYVADDLGLSIRRSDRDLSSLAEDSLDRTDDYPKRVGTISKVVLVDEDDHFYDFIDSDIPSTLNYEDYLIEGETMTVIFQSGMLAGREFEVKYYHEAKTVKGTQKEARRFEIVPQEIDGITMPDADTGYVPKEGDTYAVFGCSLPDAYINAYDPENGQTTKEGAEWAMFRQAVKYLFENEEQKFTFTGELDGIWAKKDWVNIGGKIRLGGYIKFSDERFQQEGVLVRITGIKDYINSPHSPKIELSNETITPGFSTSIKEMQSAEVTVEQNHRDALQFTKRRFRDAKETMEMLQQAFSDQFTEGISPVTIETMQMLVGDERLQFRFVQGPSNPTQVAHNVVWDAEAKTLTCPSGYIQHMTLGISSLSSTHESSEYRYFYVPKFTSSALTDTYTSTKFYLYIRVPQSEAGSTAEAAVFLETEAQNFEEGDYYWLLYGILNSEYEGERSFVTLHGYTEILPGRITTDRIVSAEGDSYFDMVNNTLKLGDRLDFNSAGDGKLRIKGTIVQSESGEENYVGCYRGVWNSAYTYYEGDEVTYTANDITSTYRYINSTPRYGIPPTSTLYWQVIAQGSKGEQGDTGEAGTDGADGSYTELRFAVNGSTTTAPAIFTYAIDPSATVTDATTGLITRSNWTTAVPTVGNLQYLWMTRAIKTGDGNTLVSEWSTPVRITPYDGTDGQDGTSPAPVYRGEYSESDTYYGTEHRIDIVKSGDSYYVARTDAGTFSGVEPPDTAKWNDFGASFESIATNLLLAELANIGGWILKDDTLISQRGQEDGVESLNYGGDNFIPNITLDAVSGMIRQGNTLALDTAGLTVKRDNGELAAQIADTSIGEYADLSDSSGSFTAQTTYDASGWMAYDSTIVDQRIALHSYEIGRLAKGSTINFSWVTFSLTCQYGTEGDNDTVVSTAWKDVKMYVELVCNGATVATLGTYTKGDLSPNETYIHEFNTAQHITVDGDTYPEGHYSIRVRATATIIQPQTSYYRGTSTVNPSITYRKYAIKQTLIGNDGLYSCMGSDTHVFSSAAGHFFRAGNYVMKITSSGIAVSKDGGESYTSLI